MLRREVEKPVEGSTVVAREILGCHSALVVSSFFCTRVLFVVMSSTFVLILLCWQSLANQVAEQAEFLHQTGEDIQLTADQLLQLERMAALERYSREQSEKVKLLEARVETLEQDNSALKDKASKLQEKVKAAAKERKGILFLL